MPVKVRSSSSSYAANYDLPLVCRARPHAYLDVRSATQLSRIKKVDEVFRARLKRSLFPCIAFLTVTIMAICTTREFFFSTVLFSTLVQRGLSSVKLLKGKQMFEQFRVTLIASYRMNRMVTQSDGDEHRRI